ncbi:MAG TPA: hypothetical protein VMN60_04135 [Longimicrobiales bacterium]|nr:hypothetical protein [Longimicrobiales bacterium]
MSARRRRLLVALLLACGGCEVPLMPPTHTSEFYEFRLDITPPRVLRWESGTTIRVHAMPGSAARAGILEGALDRGMRMWNAHALYGEYELIRAASVAEADVVLQWSDEVPPVDVAECPPQLSRAVTTFCLDDSGRHLHRFPLATGASSVRMLVTVLGSEAARGDRVDRLVSHELGHVLGIARHSAAASDLMFGGELTRATLTARDAATLRMLYHTRPDVTP